MNGLIYVMRSVLYLRYFFHKITATGSFGRQHARWEKTQGKPRLNPLKAGLYRHHVRQFHESSCSVASVACVVNTLLEIQGRLPRTVLTQQDLLDRVTTAHWKERMGPNGYQGRRGLPLAVLGEVVKTSLDIFGIVHQQVEVVEAVKAPARIKACRQKLWSRLETFETRADGVIIAHFDQGSLLPELNIPHISPVGGFNPDTGRVTLLDVDTSVPHPYTVGFDTFYKAMSTHYQHLFHLFGYGRGGYVYIRL
ncbi:MAG TPA: phytochelatin synthase family protein [Desulfotignum sp.]|nr:phytochelatin synthase family protein [Desulfotignum sp.]